MKIFNETQTGYRYNKIYFWMIFCFLFIIILKQGFDLNWDFSNKLYFECRGIELCENPYLNMECNRQWLYGDDCLIVCDEEWCKEEFLLPGTYGTPPPKIFKNLIPGLIGLILFALLLNHFLHNRGKIPDFDIIISKNKRYSFRKIMSKLIEKTEDDEN